MFLATRAEVEESADDSNGMKCAEWDVARLVCYPRMVTVHDVRIGTKSDYSTYFKDILIYLCEEGMDAQSGFRANSGTVDGLFATCLRLQKHKQHNLETWTLLVDLVKAYETVPREALVAELRRNGLPNHFVTIIIFSVDSELEVYIGVRQGSCEGPCRQCLKR
jgi:hypothetical protein